MVESDRTPNDETVREQFAKAGPELDPSMEQAFERSHVALFGKLERRFSLPRYELEKLLGSGGGGVVYEAFDPELKRQVAIKLLRLAATPDDGQRLIREGQALARLSHPNVVQIYDVGKQVQGDREIIFIVMELIRGATLAEVMGEGKTDWRALLRLHLEAGRGLAAVHAIGLQHRDFKPGNVIVGDDGRVRVLDFGLARTEGVAADAVDAPEGGDPRPITADAPLTESGAVVGTPPYMAPEQHQSRPGDARSDQFGFAVSLWEALYRERPFPQTTVTALQVSKAAGPPKPPTGTGVPPYLGEILIRALSPQPSHRFASMHDLLDALSRDPSARRRKIGVRVGIGIASALVVATVGAWVVRDPCSGAGAEFDRVWNEEARTRVSGGLLGTGLEYADATVRKVLPRLDTYALDWQLGREELCRMGRTRGRSAKAVVRADRSSWCFDQRRVRFASLIDRLETADRDEVRRAVSAAVALDPISVCLDQSVLEHMPMPDPRDRAQVLRMEATLAEIGNLRALAHYEEALASATQLRGEAEILGWGPLLAKSLGVECRLLEQVGRYGDAEAKCAASHVEAVRSSAWHTAVVAATRNTSIVGFKLRRIEDGRQWGQHAEAALAHAGDPLGLYQVHLLEALSMLDHLSGDSEAARRGFEEAMALREKALGPEHPDLTASLNNLAVVVLALGDADEARRLNQRAVDIYETAVGREHPDVAIFYSNLALTAGVQGHLDESLELHERVIGIRERTLGREHPDVGRSLVNLAEVKRKLGDDDAAALLYERAVAILEAGLRPSHPDIAQVLVGHATLLADQGEVKAALHALERALAIRSENLGDADPQVVSLQAEIDALRQPPRAGE